MSVGLQNGGFHVRSRDGYLMQVELSPLTLRTIHLTAALLTVSMKAGLYKTVPSLSLSLSLFLTPTPALRDAPSPLTPEDLTALCRQLLHCWEEESLHVPHPGEARVPPRQAKEGEMCAEPSVPRQGDGGEEGEESTGSTDGTLGWALQRALRSDLNRGWVWGWEPRNVRANGTWGMGSQVVCLDYRCPDGAHPQNAQLSHLCGGTLRLCCGFHPQSGALGVL